MLFSTSFVFACFSLIERLTVAGLPNFQDREVAFKLLEICTVLLLVKFGKGEFVEIRARWKYLGYVYKISLRDWG